MEKKISKKKSVKKKVVKKKKVDYSSQGKKNRAAGRRFEAKVRAGLEEMGWIVDKWTNTVDYDRDGKIGKVVPAKRKYNPYLRALSIGNGFPDFICIKNINGEEYDVIGIEVKKNGYLDKVERGMCHYLLDNKIFSRILIAKEKRNGKRIEVDYVDFSEKYKKQNKV